MNEGKFIGILGGMGTEATNYFYNTLHRYSDAKKDQDHLKVLLYNHSSIPDRTHYIINQENDPTNHLIDSVKLLEQSGVDFIVMPCNTAHHFYEEMNQAIQIPMINMIDEVISYVKEKHDIVKVGVLGTNGCIKSDVYNKYAKYHDIEIVYPNINEQDVINETIYCIKKGKTYDIDLVTQTIQAFSKKNDLNTLILGCTELSLLKNYLILDKIKVEDSNEILAYLTYQYGRGLKQLNE